MRRTFFVVGRLVDVGAMLAALIAFLPYVLIQNLPYPSDPELLPKRVPEGKEHYSKKKSRALSPLVKTN